MPARTQEVVEGHDVSLPRMLDVDDSNDTEVFWAWRWHKDWHRLSAHFNDLRVALTRTGNVSYLICAEGYVY